MWYWKLFERWEARWKWRKTEQCYITVKREVLQLQWREHYLQVLIHNLMFSYFSVVNADLECFNLTISKVQILCISTVPCLILFFPIILLSFFVFFWNLLHTYAILDFLAVRNSSKTFNAVHCKLLMGQISKVYSLLVECKTNPILINHFINEMRHNETFMLPASAEK